MYIPITLFELKLSANSLMGLKVCKLLGTRPKKIKITISTWFFFNRAKSLKQGRWEAFFENLAAKPPKPGKTARRAANSADIRCTQAALIGPRCRLPTRLGVRAKRAWLWSEVKVKSESESEWAMQKRSFIYPETCIYYRSCIYL